MPKNAVAILKNTNNDRASTIVVINGLAITAGSNPNFEATTGKIQPTSFATMTVKNKVKQTTNATMTVV